MANNLQELVSANVLCASYLLSAQSSLKQAKRIAENAKADAKFISGFIAGMQAAGAIDVTQAQAYSQQLKDLLEG